MNDLKNLQTVFQDFLFNENTKIKQLVVGSQKISAAQRLEIYNNAYRYRLLDALAEDYFALHKLLDDELFFEMGCLYIDTFPSTHPSLRWFGQHLEKFLATTEPYLQQPILAEIAKFEWALITAFDARNCKPVTIDSIAAIEPEAWESLRFSFAPSMQCIQLNWNVVKIWSAVNSDHKPPKLKKLKIPQTVLIWRKELETEFRSLNVEEAWAIGALSKGETFGMVCQGLCEWMDELSAAPYAAGMLKNWIIQEIISEVNPS